MNFIFEHDGLLFDVQYRHDHEGLVLGAVRSMGDDYKATGPDLVPMFKNMVLLTSEGVGEMILDRIAEEAPCPA